MHVCAWLYRIHMRREHFPNKFQQCHCNLQRTVHVVGFMSVCVCLCACVSLLLVYYVCMSYICLLRSQCVILQI